MGCLFLMQQLKKYILLLYMNSLFSDMLPYNYKVYFDVQKGRAYSAAEGFFIYLIVYFFLYVFIITFLQFYYYNTCFYDINNYIFSFLYRRLIFRSNNYSTFTHISFHILKLYFFPQLITCFPTSFYYLTYMLC